MRPPEPRRERRARIAARFTRRRPRYWMLACVPAIGLGMFAERIDAYGHVDRARPASAIVVLGAYVTETGVAGDSLNARALHAADLYKRGLAPYVVCTGGVGRYPPAEATVEAAILRARDVPAGRLIIEARSHSTRENAMYVARLCRRRGWSRVITVSDPFHLWRVHRDFALQGIQAYGSPALDSLHNRILYLRLLWTLRDALAVIRDVVLGY